MKRLFAILLPAALASVVIAVLANACTGESPYLTMTGPELFAKRCEQCHGPRGLAMKGLANSFARKRKYWEKESLLEYLDNPAAYKKKMPHLRSTSRYMPMQVQFVPDEARARLVDHVLDLMDQVQ